MRVLVTGGAGFIGSNVVDRLLLKGCEVTVVDVLHPGAHRSVPEYLNPQADFRAVDLQDETAVKQAVARVDAICHQASMVGMGQSFDDVTDFVCNNDLVTAVLLRALEASDFRGGFVLASSMVVYGEGMYSCTQHGRTRPPPRDRERLDAAEFDPTCDVCGRRLTPEAISEDAPLHPRSIYAATKLHQEHLCAVLGRERGIPVASAFGDGACAPKVTGRYRHGRRQAHLRIAPSLPRELRVQRRRGLRGWNESVRHCTVARIPGHRSLSARADVIR